MSYRVYRTDAFVLKSFPHREANRTLVLYTEDFGLIYARAQGVRHEKSRLRYALGDLSFSEVALVRGKGGWRVTGAVHKDGVPKERGALLAYARIFALVSRLVAGEEVNQLLFNILKEAKEKLLGEWDSELVEVISVSRILHTLGYVAPDSKDGVLFENSDIQGSNLKVAKEEFPRLVRRVNEALAATQL